MAVTADGTACTGAVASLARGRLSEASARYDGARASVVKYSYDLLGRPATGARVQRPFGESSEITLAFTYTYLRSGALNTIAYPSGRTVTYAYDAGSRLTMVSGGNVGQSGRIYANDIATDFAGRITGLSFGLTSYGVNVRERRCFSATSGFPVGLAVGTANVSTCSPLAGDIFNLGWTWYDNGNLNTQSDAQLGVTQSYAYDTLDRLMAAAETGGAGWSQSYGYDRYGNRWVPTMSGLTYRDPLTPGSNVFDGASNRIIGANLYDSAGNQTLVAPYTLGYDGDNRVMNFTSAVNGAGGYRYDALGRRVEARSSGTVRVFVYDAFGNLAAEYDKASGASTDSRPRYSVPDHLGSTRMTLAGAANGLDRRRFDYLPFGEDLASSVRTASQGFGGLGSPIRFTGKERDAETGLDYFGARYMSSAQGRFTSSDPLLSSAHIASPQSWNRYAYTLNNPLRFTDPFGLYICNGTNAECKDFESSLKQVERARNSYKKGSAEYNALNGSLQAYGKKGVDNGVTVQFGATRSGGAGDANIGISIAAGTANKMVTADNPSGQNTVVTFDLSKHMSNGSVDIGSLAISAAHEGIHVGHGTALVGALPVLLRTGWTARWE